MGQPFVEAQEQEYVSKELELFSCRWYCSPLLAYLVKALPATQREEVQRYPGQWCQPFTLLHDRGREWGELVQMLGRQCVILHYYCSVLKTWNVQINPLAPRRKTTGFLVKTHKSLMVFRYSIARRSYKGLWILNLASNLVVCKLRVCKRGPNLCS